MLQPELQQALLLHQGGQLARAQALYNEILRREPRNFHATHLRGVVAAQRGNAAEAMQYFDLAIAIDPGHAAPYCNRGSALRELRQLEAALADYDQAIAIEAGLPEAHSNRANVLKELQRWELAVAAYDRAIALRPDYAEAFANRSAALCELGRYDSALASSDMAVGLRPEMAEGHVNRGNALAGLGRLPDAAASYERAIALRENCAEAHCNLGSVLRKLKRLDSALARCDRALALRPDYAEAHSNRGSVLRDSNQLPAALLSFDRAIALDPGCAEAHCNQGNLLRELKRLDAAVASFDRAIGLDAEFAEAHFNRAIALLLAGDFARGWPDYEWRWRVRDSPNFREKRTFPRPLWTGGAALAGRTILLHAEQGLGDTLQFSRYVRRVAELGARVLLEVHPPLVGVLAQIPGVHRIIAKGAAWPEFDYHCPLLSLPLAFGTRLDTIPTPSPLEGNPESMQRWRRRLGASEGRRVGLAWSGSTIHPNDGRRSIPLADVVGHLAAGHQYVGLQTEVRECDRSVLAANPKLLLFCEELTDFARTAALCACMDLVITVDTSVAHLCGSLGVPTWILLPYAPDWRWLLDRTDSPWYPSVRLYRQAQPGSWDGVLQDVGSDLRRWAVP